MVHELVQRGLHVERQKAVRVVYRGVDVECGYRLDLLIENAVVVEIKSVERLDPIHVAQVLTYLKLSGHQIGLLINFKVRYLKQGIRRLILTSASSAPSVVKSPKKRTPSAPES